jgi:hypothetical protein
LLLNLFPAILPFNFNREATILLAAQGNYLY